MKTSLHYPYSYYTRELAKTNVHKIFIHGAAGTMKTSLHCPYSYYTRELAKTNFHKIIIHGAAGTMQEDDFTLPVQLLYSRISN